MTALIGAGHKRSALRTGRRALVALGAAAMVLPLGAGAASAQSFLDPANPCSGPAPAASFTDRGAIPEVHRRNVDCAAAEQITRGQTSSQFNPAGTVTRGQMASFIARTLEAGGHQLPAASDQGFNDVRGTTHETAINQLAALKITLGVTSSRYEPNAPVKRDQMASFVVRAAEFTYAVGGANDTLDGSTVGAFPFTDVTAGNTHRANIAAAVELLGVTEGRAAGTYDPRGNTTRAQMATFVVRLLDMTALPDSAR